MWQKKLFKYSILSLFMLFQQYQIFYSKNKLKKEHLYNKIKKNILNRISIGGKFVIHYGNNRLSYPNFSKNEDGSFYMDNNENIAIIEENNLRVPIIKKFHNIALPFNASKKISKFLLDKNKNQNLFFEMKNETGIDAIETCIVQSKTDKIIWGSFSQIFPLLYFITRIKLLDGYKLNLFFENNIGFINGFRLNNLGIISIIKKNITIEVGIGYLLGINYISPENTELIKDTKIVFLDSNSKGSIRLYPLHQGIFHPNTIHHILFVMRILYNENLQNLFSIPLKKKIGIEFTLSLSPKNKKQFITGLGICVL